MKRQVQERDEEEPEFVRAMFERIYNYNKDSMANGSLMRISPLAFFFSLAGEQPLEHTQFIRSTPCLIQTRSG